MMNERLIELAKQAGLKKEYGSDREYIGDFDWREFAEIIIFECVKLAVFKGDAETGRAIKEHFGVNK
jgi:hypothetical protein